MAISPFIFFISTLQNLYIFMEEKENLVLNMGKWHAIVDIAVYGAHKIPQVEIILKAYKEKFYIKGFFFW